MTSGREGATEVTEDTEPGQEIPPGIWRKNDSLCLFLVDEALNPTTVAVLEIINLLIA